MPRPLDTCPNESKHVRKYPKTIATRHGDDDGDDGDDDDGDVDGDDDDDNDENDAATTMAPKKRKKRRSNHAKRLENDRTTAENCFKTGEKEKEIQWETNRQL